MQTSTQTQEDLLAEIFAIPTKEKITERFTTANADCIGQCKSGKGCTGIVDG